MKENEIINVAEEYVRRQCENRCEMKNCDACMVNYVKQTIEIARNQKAEIEQWRDSYQFVLSITDNIRAEAIKEFVEELKKKAFNGFVVIQSIDKLVKEMVE